MTRSWRLQFCSDCGHGFLCLSMKAKRCVTCARARAAQLAPAQALAREREYGRRKEDAAQRRARAKRWRDNNPEKARAAERTRGRRKREASPETYRQATARYKDRIRREAAPDRIVRAERRLMEQATREAVTEIRRRTPLECGWCGQPFLPGRQRVYCSRECYLEANRVHFAMRRHERHDLAL